MYQLLKPEKLQSLKDKAKAKLLAKTLSSFSLDEWLKLAKKLKTAKLEVWLRLTCCFLYDPDTNNKEWEENMELLEERSVSWEGHVNFMCDLIEKLPV